MDARFPAIAEQLLLIERELRLQGWWDEVSPSAEALSSVEPFFRRHTGLSPVAAMDFPDTDEANPRTGPAIAQCVWDSGDGRDGLRRSAT